MARMVVLKFRVTEYADKIMLQREYRAPSDEVLVYSPYTVTASIRDAGNTKSIGINGTEWVRTETGAKSDLWASLTDNNPRTYDAVGYYSDSFRIEGLTFFKQTKQTKQTTVANTLMRLADAIEMTLS